ncbi:TOBE domain-containing protein [Austwickia chelonae]|uniref:Putative molybdenum-pterin binding protein n=1 Tax=Austwickia chelonae NBRC 105200 TaxID=1184607 RepID=K6V847_9MICO|nr:helix-turn-helix transcriptional regulator [Austwickia chelonae]GAB78398.1 putative molybdenum-pterin binding protein [Austwickia chelonae NBRC 105200]
MTQIRIKEAADLLGVSDDTLRRWIDAGRISATKDTSGRKTVDGADLAGLAQELHRTDIDTGQRTASARNHFTGLITSITSDTVMSQVELQCGPYRVVSLISTEAVHEMDLHIGAVATAVVKATNVILETPGATA